MLVSNYGTSYFFKSTKSCLWSQLLGCLILVISKIKDGVTSQCKSELSPWNCKLYLIVYESKMKPKQRNQTLNGELLINETEPNKGKVTELHPLHFLLAF